MTWLIFVLHSLETLMASGGEHHGSVYDLIPPAINFLILFGFLVVKLKKPVSNHFVTKAKTIEDGMKRASEKSKIAEQNLAQQKAKLAKVEQETSQIMQEAKTEVNEFAKSYEIEVEAKIKKMRTDGVSKVAAEKNSLVMEINSELINKVIHKAKEKISKDASLQTKVAANLLKELR